LHRDRLNTMLWQVSKNCPTWGGLCVDDKGLYWETLSEMLAQLGRSSDLILLQVRPENAAPDWRPAHRFNFLDNPHLPYSAKAKIRKLLVVPSAVRVVARSGH